MKTFKTLSKLALTVFMVFMVSCSKDDPAPSTPTPLPIPSGSYINAVVDGVNFTTNIFGVSTASGTRSGSGDLTLIQEVGADLGGNGIAINLLGITTTGTYTLDGNSDSVIAYTTTSGTGAFGTGGCPGATGTLIVTFLDNTKIEGTFSFIGKDVDNCATSATKTVTNGSFRCVFLL